MNGSDFIARSFELSLFPNHLHCACIFRRGKARPPLPSLSAWRSHAESEGRGNLPRSPAFRLHFQATAFS
jgi:hypothetical protein